MAVIDREVSGRCFDAAQAFPVRAAPSILETFSTEPRIVGRGPASVTLPRAIHCGSRNGAGHNEQGRED